MQIVSWAGNTYSIPNQRGDTPWSGLSDFAIAVAAKGLNTGGGNFTFLADINTGATFGFVSAYFKSRTANIAAAGFLRLAKTDVISWRNNANGADVSLSKDTSDNILWNGNALLYAGGGLIVNADISASAAIVFSKLASLTSGNILVGSAGNVPTSVALSGEATLIASGAITLSNAAVIAKVLTGYTSGAGTVASTDTLLQAVQKLNGNDALNLPLAGGTMTGDIAMGTHKVTGLGNGSAAQDAATFTQIKVIQAGIQATTTSNFSTTSSTFVDTGFSVQITPSSASNRIRLTFSGQFGVSSQQAIVGYLTLTKGTSNLAGSNGFAVVNSGTVTAGGLDVPCSVSYIDSPATTSLTTYRVYIRASSGGASARFNSDGGTAVLIAEEIV